MKKRIRLHQVRVGMYIEELEGGVLPLPHLGPVASPIDVDLIMNSHAISVVINTQKGVDVDSVHNEVQLDLIGYESALASKFSARQIRHAQDAIQDARRSVGNVFVEARVRGALHLDAADKAVERIMLEAMTNAGAMIAVAKLKKKDEGTFLHSLAVSALMVTFGRNLGLSEDAVRILGLGGLIHDLGKMVLPTALLRKPGKVTVEEMDLIRTHPERGYEMAKRIAGMPRRVLDICLYHHEKFDGSGYPHRLAGPAIPYVARIAAICDVYDALTSVRPYKRAWSQAEAIETMMSSTGHFDPDLMKAFVSKMVINGTIH
ncbi:HD family phosphohydrolase [Agrobacterium tumefaciens]|uniref:Orf_Bo164 n=2 Tax=Agrobacterium tumefaciens complex TaxID=1183400 RepID=A5WY80_AGRTU|nr:MULTISPECIES: HD-GYP domain-containing protein [Agrobacterium]AAZ50548.1 orf_Bo164 [Agrobacterium tumefaciens]ASK40914.1 HDIG domain-containing protein [Agrobacterium genomosp. 6]ASK42490.1 HDIG domain-containing protein [Agrobacterium sp.]KEY51599.1 HD family phosphohydrolase [Agrobacterium tumefaciens]QQN14657.1 HD-GYP domain-containing protein [Agrobacterium fabrum]